MKDWYSDDDFLCKCGRDACDAPKTIDPVLRIKLNGLCTELGEKLELNSAIRCAWKNASVGGSKGSQHMLAKAIDGKTKGGAHMLRVVNVAQKHGFTGFGIMKGAVHLDVRDGPALMFGY